MKKYMITIVVSLLVGFFLATYILKQYDSSIPLIPAFGNNSAQVYLIQQGVYSSMESMKNNTSNIPDYIYTTIDNMYYVYIGMTLNSNNVTKLQEYYKNKNVPTIVKTTTISDSNFIETLKQYDTVLQETSDADTIKEVCKQVLSKYQGG